MISDLIAWVVGLRKRIRINVVVKQITEFEDIASCEIR
jgi:hypothetical protein